MAMLNNQMVYIYTIIYGDIWMKFRWTGSIFERNSCGKGVDLKHHPCPNPSDLRLLKLSPVTQNRRSKVAFTRMFRMFQTFWTVLDSFGWCWTVWLEVYSVLHQGFWACFAWPAHRCGLWLFFRMLGDVRRCQAMVGHGQKSLHMTMLRQTPVHERCWRAVDVVHECKLSMARAVPYGDPAGRAICWNLFDFGWALGRFATRSWGALEWWQAKARTSSSHFPRTLTRCKSSFTSKRTGDIWRHLATSGDRIPACKMTGDHCAALNFWSSEFSSFHGWPEPVEPAKAMHWMCAFRTQI